MFERAVKVSEIIEGDYRLVFKPTNDYYWVYELNGVKKIGEVQLGMDGKWFAVRGNWVIGSYADRGSACKALAIADTLATD